MHNISNLFYFGTTLHVSDGLSVYHQESKTIHTASGICHTDSEAYIISQTDDGLSGRNVLLD